MRRIPLKTILAIAQRNVPDLQILHIGPALRQRRFESIEPWRNRATHRIDELYIILYQEGVGIARENPDYSFLLVANSSLNESTLPAALSNVVVVYADDALPFFDALRSSVHSIACWIDQMQDKILSVCSFQDLFDVSEGVLGHWASVANNSFQLLAYTRNIPVDDPVCTYFIENGFHPKETIERMLAHQATDESEPYMRKGLVIRQSDSLMKYPSLRQTLYEKGTEFGHLIMVIEDGSHYDELLVSLFRIFADHLQKLTHIRGYQSPHINQPYELLLTSIANERFDSKNLQDVHQLKQIARSLDVDTNKSYLIGYVSSAREVTQNTLKHFTQVIQETLQQPYVAYRQNDILLLLDQQKFDFYKAHDRLDTIDSYLGIHGLTLFLSAPCNEFESLPLAFAQASGAAKAYEEAREANSADTAFKNIMSFDDIFLQWILTHGSRYREFACECVRRRPFGKIIHSEEFGPAFLDIVTTYLQNERNGTKVSQLVNMNRGSLLYNVKRCEKRFNISFDDYETRLEFLFLNEFCRACRVRHPE